MKSSPSQNSSLLFLLVHSFTQSPFIEKLYAPGQMLRTELEKEEIDKIPSSLKFGSTTNAKTHSCVWG